MKTNTRGQEEEVALSAVYDFLTYLSMGEEIDVEGIVSGLCEAPYEECSYFVKSMLLNAVKHYGEIVETYRPHLRKWEFSRLNRLEQALLIYAYCHYFYWDEKTDKGVVIDVAVRLSKKYLEPSDYKFVNAILDKVLDGR